MWFTEGAADRVARIGSGVNVVVRAPAVYGAGRVGERALCDQGAWKASLDIGSYAFQWMRDGLDVAGATDVAYTSLAADEGHQLGCRVTASPAHQLALYSGLSSAITVAPQAVGPAGPPGGAGGQGTGGPASTGANGVAGVGGVAGSEGAAGARGAAATAVTTAVLLHSHVTTSRGKRFLIRYLAGKAARLVLTVRKRSGQTVARLGSVTTRKAGRGSIGARHSLASGSYTLVLTVVGATAARVVDVVPLTVRKA